MLLVIVIARNEALKLRDCLKSVSGEDGIMVLNSLSIANAVNMTKQSADRVYVKSMTGFDAKKNNVKQNVFDIGELTMECVC